jgi:hypothetical protein
MLKVDFIEIDILPEFYQNWNFPIEFPLPNFPIEFSLPNFFYRNYFLLLV